MSESVWEDAEPSRRPGDQATDPPLWFVGDSEADASDNDRVINRMILLGKLKDGTIERSARLRSPTDVRLLLQGFLLKPSDRDPHGVLMSWSRQWVAVRGRSSSDMQGWFELEMARHLLGLGRPARCRQQVESLLKREGMPDILRAEALILGAEAAHQLGDLEAMKADLLLCIGLGVPRRSDRARLRYAEWLMAKGCSYSELLPVLNPVLESKAVNMRGEALLILATSCQRAGRHDLEARHLMRAYLLSDRGTSPKAARLLADSAIIKDLQYGEFESVLRSGRLTNAGAHKLGMPRQEFVEVALGSVGLPGGRARPLIVARMWWRRATNWMQWRTPDDGRHGGESE
jgi:hypothetical protein